MVAVSTKKITPDEFYRMPDNVGFELVNGELVERDVSNKSSRIGVRVSSKLESFCDVTKSGWVFGPDQGYVCFPSDPLRVRKPDVSVIIKNRMTPEEYQQDGYCPIVPDLVVEVISPNDVVYDVEAKRDEWLDAGVKLVWIINPERKTIAFHYKSGKEGLLREADTLTAEPILPGFTLPVAELFALPV